MRTRDKHESPAQRKERIRQLVIELDSYSAAARQLGLTSQRVQQLAGPGLTSQSQSRERTYCDTCGEALAGRSRSKGQCRRCATWVQKHGTPRSAEAARQATGPNLRSHCKRGHPLTDDNLYVTGGKRQCRICARERSARWRQTPVGRQVVATNNRRQRERHRRGEHPAATSERQTRIAQMQALVRELDSYAEAAKLLGVSTARVRTLAGPGLTSRARSQARASSASPTQPPPRPSPQGIRRDELRALVLHERSYRKAATIAGLSVGELKALVGADLHERTRTATA